jgi:hypothetical protein
VQADDSITICFLTWFQRRSIRVEDTAQTIFIQIPKLVVPICCVDSRAELGLFEQSRVRCLYSLGYCPQRDERIMFLSSMIFSRNRLAKRSRRLLAQITTEQRGRRLCMPMLPAKFPLVHSYLMHLSSPRTVYI